MRPTEKLLWIALSALAPHPSNPRLLLREAVVESIAAQLRARGSFSPAHALVVRRLGGGRYQIVAGHHRAEAARRAGLRKIPCWIVRMTDDEAFMALVLTNQQEELAPLEIGLHALDAIALVKGGRGNKGGLAAYACRIGLTKQYVSILRDGAVVFRSITAEKGSGRTDRFFNRATHLATIHAAPEKKWGTLAAKMLAESWTVNETKAHVARILGKKTSDDARGAHLSEDERVVIRRARAIKTRRAEHRKRDREKQRAAILRKKHPLSGESYRLLVGDLEDAGAEIEDESVDAIICDPPYAERFLPVFDRLARLAARVLKPGGSLVVMSGQAHLPEVFRRLRESSDANLRYQWTLAYTHATTHDNTVIFGRRVTSLWKPLLFFTKGQNRHEFVRDIINAPSSDDDKKYHEWGQSVGGFEQIVQRFTVPGDVVLDPFVGGGTTGVAALRSGRIFIGIDIDLACVKQTASRLASACENDAEVAAPGTINTSMPAHGGLNLMTRQQKSLENERLEILTRPTVAEASPATPVTVLAGRSLRGERAASCRRGDPSRAASTDDDQDQLSGA